MFGPITEAEKLREERDAAVLSLAIHKRVIGDIEFEVGCMEHYGAEKSGMLAKLAREMAQPIREHLDWLGAAEAE